MTDSQRPLGTGAITSQKRGELALFTDFYELTMLRAYEEHGMTDRAVFSLFVRKLPPGRNFLIACGVDDVLDALESLVFAEEDIAYLSTQRAFAGPFLNRLAEFRFTGDVHAVPEGTPIFANEPILEIVAPIGEAQLIETLVLNQIGLQTILASKAARVVQAAQGRPVVDFGGRRAQGLDAAVKGVRAFFVAGVSATSNVLAAKKYGIPVTGTMAHSFIAACPSELEAFRRFAEVFPDTVLLVDTYDTLQGVRNVIELAHALAPSFHVRGIRLDSGDLLRLSVEARRMLDEAGLSLLKIFASGGLDEREIDRLLRAGAPIDAFGVGTDMSVSGDAPSLDIAYKLTEYGGTGRMKLSTGKRTLPGQKQVFREIRDGRAVRDVIGRFNEVLPGRPLLAPVMRKGRRLPHAHPTLAAIRAYARDAFRVLPDDVQALAPVEHPFEVAISPMLAEDERRLREQIMKAIRSNAGGSG